MIFTIHLYLHQYYNKTLSLRFQMRTFLIAAIALFFSCTKSANEQEKNQTQNSAFSAFREISTLELEGGFSAAEISAYSPKNHLLFVSNNARGNRVDVINLSEPLKARVVNYLTIDKEGEQTINSVAVSKDYLAVAANGKNPQNSGHVFLYKISDLSLLRVFEVGAMPDMVTFSPNGSYLLTANEGEPNQKYSDDPEGTVSIISIPSFSVSEITFSISSSKLDSLKSKGFRIFGPEASFSQDVEPEYIAVSDDSKYAWVTLQENNGIAKIDLWEKQVVDIFPLGFKNFNIKGNEIDVCDNDSIIVDSWPIKGLYQPDAIVSFKAGDKYYLLTANEGDSRDYEGYSEISRVSDLPLDQEKFSSQIDLENCKELSRLIVTTTMGDTDNDGDYDELYTFGSRSFSIWNGETGELMMDSKAYMEKDLINNSKLYDDDRSDDKGTEPEGIALGKIGDMPLAVIALERANAVMIYDLTKPQEPKFLQVLETGIGPEGVLFIDSSETTNHKPMIVVSSEVDGKIKLYQPE